MMNHFASCYRTLPTGLWRTRSLAWCAALLLAPCLALAQDKHGTDDIKKDVQRHRAMAAAHEAAARCLEARKPHEQCEKDLQAACKGLAIGKYCGMRHEH